MAIVVSIGEWRREQPAETPKNWVEKWLEKPFCMAELHRARISRVEHPGRVDNTVIELLYVWAALYVGISAYWFVKYVIN